MSKTDARMSGTEGFKGKTAPYRETFLRHRYLLSAPIVIAVIVAVWSVLGSPKAYQSTTRLWIENPPEKTSASPANVGQTPAQQEQSVFSELLSTQKFALAVGRNTPLAQYLATHGPSGWSPTALLSGGGGGSLDSKLIAAVGPKNVAIGVVGPQVLQVGFSGPTPALAASTLGALVNQLEKQTASYKAGSAFSVIDSPSPGASLTSHKKQLLAIIGGLFAGALISLLGTVALTPGRADPWEDESRAAMGATAVAGAINGTAGHPDAEFAAAATATNGPSSVAGEGSGQMTGRTRVLPTRDHPQPPEGSVEEAAGTGPP
jgi:hypothetical protein